MAFLTEIFFAGGTQPSWKITEIPVGGGYDKHPRNGNSRGVLKQKHPLWGGGGMDTFWSYTT